MVTEDIDPQRPVAAASRMIRTLRLVERAVALLCLTAVGASALVLMTIFVLISYSVAMRYVLGLPQPWIDEAVGWLLAASVMLAVPEVQRRGEHIGIDIMARKLRGRGYRALALFAVATVLASAAIYVREGIEMVTFSRMLNVLSNQIPEVPLWLVQGVVPVGFGLMVLVALVQFACLLAGLPPGIMRQHAIEDV
jgi:TRAP-type C4-dicarboxylate transport system permease small subunit